MTKRIEHDLWQEGDDLEIVVTHDHPVDLTQATTIIKVTEEGIIIDFYSDGDLTGTIGMTYDEWFDMSQRGFIVNEKEAQ